MARHRHSDGIGGFDIQRDEFDLGIDAVGAEVAPGQGVVEGLVQLLIDQPAQQCGVVIAGAHPQRAIVRLAQQHGTQARHAFGNVVVVKRDTCHCVVARTAPIARFEPLLGTCGNRGKVCVIVLEGFIHGLARWPVRDARIAVVTMADSWRQCP